MSMSAGNNSVTSQSDYWNDDFLPLRNAGKSILKVLRSDETSSHGDLYRRILSTTPTTTSTIPSDADPINHHYFSDGCWKHSQSMPLPPFLQEKLSKAKQYSMMGLFPEAELAWLTIDDCIYLWTFTRSADGELLYFQVPSQQPIVSVGIAPPKPGKYFVSHEETQIEVQMPNIHYLCLHQESFEKWSNGVLW